MTHTIPLTFNGNQMPFPTGGTQWQYDPPTAVLTTGGYVEKTVQLVVGGSLVGSNAAHVDDPVPEGDPDTNQPAAPTVRSGLTGVSASDLASGVSLGWSIADRTDDHSGILLLDAAPTPVAGNITGIEATIIADANTVKPGSFLTVTTDA